MDDYAQLVAAMQSLTKAVRRPGHWAHIAGIAGVDIDRPSAALLLTVDRSTKTRVQDVAQELGIEAPSVTRRTQALEQQGLLERVPDPKDKRGVMIQITPTGHEMAQKLWYAKQAFISSALESWPEAERHEFVQLFTKFADSLTERSNKHH